MSAIKNDQDKPDLSLIPKVALVEEAKAFMVGEKKYGRYNFEKGMEATRIMSAILRHATDWLNGEEYDPKDGQHHLGAIRANCGMILRQMELGTLIDNRSGKAKAEETVPEYLKQEIEQIAKSAKFIYGDSQTFTVTKEEISERYVNGSGGSGGKSIDNKTRT